MTCVDSAPHFIIYLFMLQERRQVSEIMEMVRHAVTDETRFL